MKQLIPLSPEVGSRKHESHMAQTALNRGELTDEEAYYILRFAGRMGYDRAIRRLSPGYPWRNLRRWFVRTGWETPELGQWDGNLPRWRFVERDRYTGKLRWFDPFPLTILNRLTIFGRWWHLRCFGGYLVCSNEYAYKWPNKLYWSRNGTPWQNARVFWCRRWQTRQEKKWDEAD